MVAPGKSADFIVLDANPLESISNTRQINKVYLRGAEVPRAAMAAKWQAQFRRAASLRRSAGYCLSLVRNASRASTSFLSPSKSRATCS